MDKVSGKLTVFFEDPFWVGNQNWQFCGSVYTLPVLAIF